MERAALHVGPVCELVEEPTLTHPSLGNDEVPTESWGLAQVAERLLQHRQFVRAANHPCLDPLDPARGYPEGIGSSALHEIGLQRSIDAFDEDRWFLDHIEQASDVSIGVVADPQAAWRCMLFHSSGEVDRAAANIRSSFDPADDDNGAGVEADANIERFDRHSPGELHFDPNDCGEHCQTSTYSLLSTVFLSVVDAEDGQQPIAGVLDDTPEMRTHQFGEPSGDSVHQIVNVLRIERRAESSRTDDIDEQHRRLTQPRLGITALRSRHCGELGQQWSNRDIDDSVTEQAALRLERNDRRIEGSPIRRHPPSLARRHRPHNQAGHLAVGPGRNCGRSLFQARPAEGARLPAG